MAGIRIGGSSSVTYTSPPYVILELDGYYNIWRVLSNVPVQMSIDSADIDDVRQGPELSPDGSQILFEKRPNAGGIEVWVMDADGANEAKVDGDESVDEYAQYPSWSPDGATVIYTWNSIGGVFGGEIRTANPDGTGITTIWTPPADAAARRPRYSADGTRIAFLVNDDGGGGSTYSPPELWTADDDGTNDAAIVTLVASMFDQCQFSWANLSNVIAYYEGNSGPTIGGIHKVNDDGTGDTLLNIDTDGTLVSISDLAWSPSDDRVFFNVYEDPGTGLSYHPHAADSDGSNEALLYDALPAGGLNNTLHSVWVYRNRLWFFPGISQASRYRVSSISLTGAAYKLGHDITDGGVGDVFYDETGFENR